MALTLHSVSIARRANGNANVVLAVYGDLRPGAAVPGGPLSGPPRPAHRGLPAAAEAPRQGGLPGARGVPQAQR